MNLNDTYEHIFFLRPDVCNVTE